MHYWIERREQERIVTDNPRSDFDMDFARIVHSPSFRRLQSKTQVLNLGDSDFYRTRLTHSLEVAQIAVSISRELAERLKEYPPELAPEQNLLQAICFAHDLGHPPFGHGGETALNYCMRDNGGFEGNGQTLRILSKLETFSKKEGSNLTRRTLLGLLKYPIPYSQGKSDVVPALIDGTSVVKVLHGKKCKPPKSYLDTEIELVKWILKEFKPEEQAEFVKTKAREAGKHLKTIHKSFDCSIMDLSDSIAYGVHDLEDAIALGLLTAKEFKEDVNLAVCKHYIEYLVATYKGRGEFAGDKPYDEFVEKLFDEKHRKHQINRLVGHFIRNIKITEVKEFSDPLLRFRIALDKDVEDFLQALVDCVWKRVIQSPRVRHLEFKGQMMVVSVFETLASDPDSLLPAVELAKYHDAGKNNRIICDYIAGLTDHGLLKTYERLFSPRMGSLFDKV